VNELGDAFGDVLRAASSGDRQAFALLWRSAHPGLLRYLKVIAGPEAEDVASETWLKAMRGLPSFAGDESSFRGWLAVIARNTLADVRRRAARRPEQLTGDIDEHSLGLAHDSADLAMERVTTAAALELVSTLPPAVAEMVALRVIVGLDVAEVAHIVDRSSGAVRVAVHRGLRSLAAQLEPRTPVTPPVTGVAEEPLTE
jgi:RNA polymerase sigma-70 factor (ECF subfamily)